MISSEVLVHHALIEVLKAASPSEHPTTHLPVFSLNQYGATAKASWHRVKGHRGQSTGTLSF